MFTRKEVAAECRRRCPDPEHGPGQYLVVIRHLHAEHCVDVRDFATLDEAVKPVFDFMEIG